MHCTLLQMPNMCHRCCTENLSILLDHRIFPHTPLISPGLIKIAIASASNYRCAPHSLSLVAQSSSRYSQLVWYSGSAVVTKEVNLTFSFTQIVDIRKRR